MSEKIGEGLQYNVFDLGDGKVRKVPKSREEMMDHCFKGGDSQEKAEESTSKALERREKAVEKLKNECIDSSIFGSPEFKENGEVVQDKVKPVDQVFENASLEQKKQIIDKYVELLRKLWEQGMGDTIYNFTVNTGLTDQGDLIMLDFGEIVFSKQRVKKEVKGQKWLDKWSYSQDLEDERVKEYFKERMAEEITVGMLEDKWEKNMREWEK